MRRDCELHVGDDDSLAIPFLIKASGLDPVVQLSHVVYLQRPASALDLDNRSASARICEASIFTVARAITYDSPKFCESFACHRLKRILPLFVQKARKE